MRIREPLISAWRLLVHGVVAATIILVCGTFLHEGGHALVTLLSGGEVTEVVILGIRVFPEVSLYGEFRSFGHVRNAAALDPIPQAWSGVAGSGTTALVGLLAFLLWNRSSRTGVVRTAQLACMALVFDAFCHSLPWIGIPMYVVFGSFTGKDPRMSELVAGSIELGVPEGLIYSFVFALPIVVVVEVARTMWRRRKAAD